MFIYIHIYIPVDINVIHLFLVYPANRKQILNAAWNLFPLLKRVTGAGGVSIFLLSPTYDSFKINNKKQNKTKNNETVDVHCILQCSVFKCTQPFRTSVKLPTPWSSFMEVLWSPKLWSRNKIWFTALIFKLGGSDMPTIDKWQGHQNTLTHSQ